MAHHPPGEMLAASTFASSAGRRLSYALIAVALLWLAVGWALGWF